MFFFKGRQGPRSDRHMLSASGFTLIELMVTLSVASILAFVAVPNFSDYIARSRASSEVRSAVHFLSLARSEAISRGGVVHVSPVSQDWTGGWRSWVDLNGNAQFDDGEQLKQLPAFSAAVVAATRSGSAVSELGFDKEGFANQSAVTVISYRTSPEKCSLDRTITVSLSGQVSIVERACS